MIRALYSKEAQLSKKRNIPVDGKKKQSYSREIKIFHTYFYLQFLSDS